MKSTRRDGGLANSEQEKKLERREGEKEKKNRAPKKSTGRDGGLTNRGQDNHLERKRKRKKIENPRNQQGEMVE
jgi:hypothetical protein